MVPDNTKNADEPLDENQKGEHETLSKDTPQTTGSEEASENVASNEAASGSPQFADLKEVEGKLGEKKRIDFLYDIKLDVNIELGRAELKVKDILSLQPGSIVELNRLAGDPVEIVVNNKLIARGEVIVIDDNFAVRVTDILDPAELAQKLNRGRS